MFSDKSKRNIFLLHFMVWLMLFTIPFLLAKGNEELYSRIVENTWIPLLFYAFVFYLNYYLLIDSYFFKGNYRYYLILNGLIIFVFVMVIFKMKTIFFNPLPDLPRPPKFELKELHKGPPRQLFIYMDILWFGVPLAFSLALKSFEKLKKTEQEQQESEKVKLEQELQYLRYQLQPHFFFNALNNIYSMVDVTPDKAKESIHGLGKLMRFLLYESNTEKVTLNKEIEFMTTYIELMKLRFSDKISIAYNFPEVQDQVKIPPLLFITLVENAFKHGVSATKNSSIVFTMTYTDLELFFVAQNDYFPKNQKDKSGSGIGLANLDKRLTLLYKDKYSLVTEIKDQKYVATLLIEAI
jgi:hypothetical protein